jgi:GTP-binding protein
MKTKQTLPVVAIIGRPNVGKSTLFNRLINKRLAITSEIAGTTRDRIYYHVDLNKTPAILVDTGGMEHGKKKNIEADVQTQVQLAIADADLILFMIDAKEGLTVEDYDAASSLRKSKKEIMIIANKFESGESESNIIDSLKLGFGHPLEISAYHNRNIEELIDETEKKLAIMGFQKAVEDEQLQKKIINLCFIGKPNVGKSSMVNALLGEKKVIVSDIPGTTRDAVDTQITVDGQQFNLIDTAGLRRKGKIEQGLEKLSTFRTIDAIERSDVVCLILDYEEGIKKQDQHICAYALEAGKGLILIVNKIDLMEDRQKDEAKMINILRSRFDFLPWAPVVFVSALKHKNIENVLQISKQIYHERFKIIPADELNRFIKEITYKHMPPSQGAVIIRFYTLDQIRTNPPTFVFHVNNPDAVHFSYKRYLENELRAKYNFTGTAIKMIFKN